MKKKKQQLTSGPLNVRDTPNQMNDMSQVKVKSIEMSQTVTFLSFGKQYKMYS